MPTRIFESAASNLQNDFLIDRPSVFTVDYENRTALATAFEAALRLPRRSALPPEFSFVGHLERVATIIARLDICTKSASAVAAEWRRVGSRRVGAPGASCSQTCRASPAAQSPQNVCEPAFFPFLNTLRQLHDCANASHLVATYAPALCALQADPTLFSCATRPPPDVRRVCACRRLDSPLFKL